MRVMTLGILLSLGSLSCLQSKGNAEAEPLPCSMRCNLSAMDCLGEECVHLPCPDPYYGTCASQYGFGHECIARQCVFPCGDDSDCNPYGDITQNQCVGGVCEPAGGGGGAEVTVDMDDIGPLGPNAGRGGSVGQFSFPSE